MSTRPTGQKPRDPQEDKDYDDWKQGTGTAPGIATQAYEYGQKISDAATTARDYVGDKVSVAGDKFKDLQYVDYKQYAEEVKTYAREKPGQALLISASAGFLIGLLLRSGRRR